MRKVASFNHSQGAVNTIISIHSSFTLALFNLVEISPGPHVVHQCAYYGTTHAHQTIWTETLLIRWFWSSCKVRYGSFAM